MVQCPSVIPSRRLCHSRVACSLKPGASVFGNIRSILVNSIIFSVKLSKISNIIAHINAIDNYDIIEARGESMNKLRNKRQEAGLRQVDLSVLSGVSIATVWCLENGLDRRAKPETRKKIIAGLKIAGLIIGEKDVFPE